MVKRGEEERESWWRLTRGEEEGGDGFFVERNKGETLHQRGMSLCGKQGR